MQESLRGEAPHPDEDELEIIPGGDVQQRARNDIIANYIPVDWELHIGQVWRLVWAMLKYKARSSRLNLAYLFT